MTDQTPGEQRMQRAERQLRKEYGASVIKSWVIAVIVILAIPVMVGLYAWLVA